MSSDQSGCHHKTCEHLDVSQGLELGPSIDLRVAGWRRFAVLPLDHVRAHPPTTGAGTFRVAVWITPQVLTQTLNSSAQPCPKPSSNLDSSPEHNAAARTTSGRGRVDHAAGPTWP